LDRQREGHREINIAFRHVRTKRLGDQQGADHDQERQREDLKRGVLLDEVADGARRQHHHPDRDDDGGNHHLNVVHQAYGGDHRIQREDDIDHRDLQDDPDESGLHRTACAARLLFLALDAVPDFHGALEQQEQATEEQDQITPGNPVIHDGEQVVGQAHDPGDRQQQQDPRAHRQRQTEEARLGLLLLGQARYQDRDEDDVVDTEDDFQGGQGQERDPDFRAAQPFHKV